MIVAQPSAAEYGLSDDEVVNRVLGGDTAMFELLMRRYNQLVYRAARAILREDTEAEDVMQEAYVRAYQNLRQFAGRSKFSTWICRIAINEALKRRRRGSLYQEPPMSDDEDRPMGQMDQFVSPAPDPEQQASSEETRRLLENAIEALPEMYRTVFVLREVEDLDTQNTAQALDIAEDAVKTRLRRARVTLRKYLFARIGASRKEVFPFPAPRCDRVVTGVFKRLTELAAEIPGGQPEA